MTDLTPTEELLLEVLIARARLGEAWWTFDYRHRKTLNSLEAKGLIWTESAPTPHIEGHLTDKAREEFLSRPYTPQGAKVEWAVQTDDDVRPVHYVMRGDGHRDEEYHRKFAARHNGALFRRATVVMPWVQVPLEVTR